VCVWVGGGGAVSIIQYLEMDEELEGVWNMNGCSIIE
jgi:hypothetical protein